jgi:hypothetical protein
MFFFLLLFFWKIGGEYTAHCALGKKKEGEKMMKGGESPQPTHKQHLPFNYAQQQNKNLEMFFFFSLL